MKNKPIIFTILSLLCLIEPAIKVLYFKAITHFDFLVIWANLKSRNTFMEVFDFWLVFPIAGLLLLKIRKWTYFAFMSVLGYIVYNITTYERYTWPYNSDSPFLYNYIIAFLAMSVFLYFLSPGVREPFFDRRVRWWEPKSRYDVQIYCKLQSSHVTFPSEILNISRTGAFIKDSKYLNIGEKLIMEFNFLGENISVPVEVIHRNHYKQENGFGLKFHFKSVNQSIKIAKVIQLLKKSRQSFDKIKSAA